MMNKVGNGNKSVSLDSSDHHPAVIIIGYFSLLPLSLRMATANISLKNKHALLKIGKNLRAAEKHILRSMCPMKEKNLNTNDIDGRNKWRIAALKTTLVLCLKFVEEVGNKHFCENILIGWVKLLHTNIRTSQWRKHGLGLFCYLILGCNKTMSKHTSK